MNYKWDEVNISVFGSRLSQSMAITRIDHPEFGGD
ncbi:MAG: hypothetical protein ACI8QD_002303 [Cyclobacteriaceae bacterium]|jgi:hypothetical protein